MQLQWPHERMLSGLALLLLVCLHMRVQGKPRSQVGPASPLLGPGGTWETARTPGDAAAVRGALHADLPTVSVFWEIHACDLKKLLHSQMLRCESASVLELVSCTGQCHSITWTVSAAPVILRSIY